MRIISQPMDHQKITDQEIKSDNQALHLSDKEQLLLSRYFDGECGPLATILARRKITTSRTAREYVEKLRTSGNYLRERDHAIASGQLDLPGISQGYQDNLWRRIDARIEQELVTARYLGRRDVNLPKSSIWERISPPSAAIGALSGATLAIFAIISISKPNALVSFSAPQAGPISDQRLVQPVAIGSGVPLRAYSGNISAPRGRSFEVDWVRSTGAISLIPDSTGSSAITWIRRREIKDYPYRRDLQSQPNIDTVRSNSHMSKGISVDYAQRSLGYAKQESARISVRTIQAALSESMSSENTKQNGNTEPVRSIRLDQHIQDLESKLTQLPFSTFQLLRRDDATINLRTKNVLHLHNGQSLIFRPIYIDSQRVGLWLNWRDTNGTEILNTRLHFDAGHSVITGTDMVSEKGATSDRGIILAINLMPLEAGEKSAVE